MICIHIQLSNTIKFYQNQQKMNNLLSYFIIPDKQNINKSNLLTFLFKYWAQIIIQNHSMSIYELVKYETNSGRTTEEDSSSDRDEEMYFIKTNPAKHKTELCKTFQELGSCPYNTKCRFAHGRHELVRTITHRQAKNKRCNGFWKNGSCSYGLRCQFGHSEVKWEDSAIFLGLSAAYSKRSSKNSKLMILLN